jgi:hypothetical protein
MPSPAPCGGSTSASFSVWRNSFAGLFFNLLRRTAKSVDPFGKTFFDAGKCTDALSGQLPRWLPRCTREPGLVTWQRTHAPALLAASDLDMCAGTPAEISTAGHRSLRDYQSRRRAFAARSSTYHMPSFRQSLLAKAAGPCRYGQRLRMVCTTDQMGGALTCDGSKPRGTATRNAKIRHGGAIRPGRSCNIAMAKRGHVIQLLTHALDWAKQMQNYPLRQRPACCASPAYNWKEQ